MFVGGKIKEVHYYAYSLSDKSMACDLEILVGGHCSLGFRYGWTVVLN